MSKTTIRNPIVCLTMLAGFFSQQFLSAEAFADEKPAANAASLRKALTFHASFDQGTDADFGKGDRRLFAAPSLNDRKTGKPGLPESGVVSVAKGEGRFGDALRFHRSAPDVVFFQVEQNFLYSKSNWNGTVSFWLKLDPNKDLGPGYCDPLFITPRVFNDGALWVDFSDKAPRQFRHGAFPDRKVWDPNLRDFDKTPEAERPVATVKEPPFSGDQWTHIVISFANFNTGKPDGVSSLYLNGKLAGNVMAREQTYTWEPAQSTAVLGINYIGLFDELSFFNRALSAVEVKELFDLSDSIARRP
jgi:Concanavalin A-like lectin/glucanases superfamily